MQSGMTQNKVTKIKGKATPQLLHKINLNANIPGDQSTKLLLFRKPRKAIKTLPIHTESCFIDQNTKREVTELMSKYHSRSLENDERRHEDFMQFSSHKKEPLFEHYQDIKGHQMFAHSLPMTNKSFKPKRKIENLTLNLKQVDKLRSKTEIKKIAISPSQFQNTIGASIGNTVGFRPFSGRNLPKKDFNLSLVDIPHMGGPRTSGRKIDHKRLRSRKMVSKEQFQKLFSRSSGNLLFSECLTGEYRAKSQLKSARVPMNTLNFIKKTVYS